MLISGSSLRRLLVPTLFLVLASTAAGSPAEPPEEPQSPPAAESEPRPDASTDDETEDTQAAQPFRNVKTFPAVDLDPRRQVWVGEPISLSLRDADLVEVLRSFAKMTDVNLVIDPSVKGTVTVELRDVPWDHALYVILKVNGLGMEISGNVWTMMPANRLYEDD